jgi:hypothetical protein
MSGAAQWDGGRGLWRSSLALWQSLVGCGLAQHRRRVREEDGDGFGAPKGGAPGGAFIRDQLSGVVQGILHRFYLQFAPYLKDFRLDSKKGGNLHRLQFGSIQVMIGVTSTRGRVYNLG